MDESFLEFFVQYEPGNVVISTTRLLDLGAEFDKFSTKERPGRTGEAYEYNKTCKLYWFGT